jgi:hypothetical protein
MLIVDSEKHNGEAPTRQRVRVNLSQRSRRRRLFAQWTEPGQRGARGPAAGAVAPLAVGASELIRILKMTTVISRAGRKTTAQPWCGGTLSRSQSSRSASLPEGVSSHSSLVVSGRDSPKMSLTESGLRGESRVTVASRCDEDHTSSWEVVHVEATQSRDPRPGKSHTPNIPASAARRDGCVARTARGPRSPSWTAGR